MGNKVCNGCLDNRISARVRRIFILFKPTPVIQKVATPLDLCLRKYQKYGDEQMDPECARLLKAYRLNLEECSL
jgi:hypothetical protein